MSVKILKKYLMILLIVLFFSSCARKEIVYVDRVVETNIPIKCITPTVKCNYAQPTYTELIHEMDECIEKFKKANEVCK